MGSFSLEEHLEGLPDVCTDPVGTGARLGTRVMCLLLCSPSWHPGLWIPTSSLQTSSPPWDPQPSEFQSLSWVTSGLRGFRSSQPVQTQDPQHNLLYKRKLAWWWDSPPQALAPTRTLMGSMGSSPGLPTLSSPTPFPVLAEADPWTSH